MYEAEGVPAFVIHEAEENGKKFAYKAPPLFPTPGEANTCEVKHQRARKIEEYLKIDQQWLLDNFGDTLEEILEAYKAAKAGGNGGSP